MLETTFHVGETEGSELVEAPPMGDTETPDQSRVAVFVGVVVCEHIAHVVNAEGSEDRILVEAHFDLIVHGVSTLPPYTHGLQLHNEQT